MYKLEAEGASDEILFSCSFNIFERWCETLWLN